MTVGLCVPATLLGWFGALLLKNLAVLSAAWWFAFSGSLFLSEIRQEDLRNRSSVEKA
jgi:hypothetical protein